MIKFTNIDLSFEDRKVFTDLSLEVNQGEKVVLFGKSGIGKSSLFGLILGFIRPQNGEIKIDKELVDDKSVWNIRKKIAFVDQDTSIGGGKVLDLISSISGIKANSFLDFSRDNITKLLDQFELNSDTLNSDIEKLSGGERQRLALIIAILLKRKIYLLDEVTSALDNHLKKKVADYFISQENLTCLIIAHDSVWSDNSLVKIFEIEAGKWQQ